MTKEKELEFVKNLRDIDEFNYSRSLSNYIPIVTLLIYGYLGLCAIIFSLDVLDRILDIVIFNIKLNSVLIILLSLFFLILLLYNKRGYEGQINGHRNKFNSRNEYIKKIYKDSFNIDVDKLTEQSAPIS